MISFFVREFLAIESLWIRPNPCCGFGLLPWAALDWYQSSSDLGSVFRLSILSNPTIHSSCPFTNHHRPQIAEPTILPLPPRPVPAQSSHPQLLQSHSSTFPNTFLRRIPNNQKPILDCIKKKKNPIFLPKAPS